MTSIIPREEFNVIDDELLYLKPDFHAFTLQKMLNVDFRTLTSSIHAHFNCSFLDYIKKKKVNYICEKIHNGSIRSFKDIQDIIGTNTKTISTDFASVLGKTPEEIFAAYEKLHSLKLLMKTYSLDDIT